MVKKRKKKNLSKRNIREIIPKALGFDFGKIRKILALSDTDFNQKLRDAKIFGCAYGFQQLQGTPDPIPCITLIVENKTALEAAFEHFKRWGCVTDGDSIDIHIILKKDKKYEMWIGPEMHRSIYRTVPQTDIFDPIIMNVSYVKNFDTTNNFLFDLKEYLDSSMLSPVLVTFAVNPPGNLNPNSILELEHLPKIIKFDLKIDFENEDGSNPKFGKFKPVDSTPHDLITPQYYCRNRKKVFDVAFPVTREKIMSGDYINTVRTQAGCMDLSQTQIIQAIINLVLSDELQNGSLHYQSLQSKNYDEAIWKYVDTRVEAADGKELPSFITPELIIEQIKLDIRAVLDKNQTDNDLNHLQIQFRKEGFIND